MAGRRKKNATNSEAETVAVETPVAVAEAPQEQVKEMKVEEPPETKGTPEAERFRSWVTDRGNGYERLTDDKAKLLVLRFTNKPAAEVLDKLKAAGFRYQPEYFGQQKVWTRRNDFEGRLKVEELEKQVRGTVPDVG